MPSVTCLFLVVAPRGLFHVSLLLLLPFCFVSLPCWILWSSRWITKALGEFSSFSFERSQLWEEQPRPVTTWLYGFKCSFLNLFALLFFFLLAWIIPVTLAQAVNIAAGTPPFFCLFFQINSGVSWLYKGCVRPGTRCFPSSHILCIHNK